METSFNFLPLILLVKMILLIFFIGITFRSTSAFLKDCYNWFRSLEFSKNEEPQVDGIRPHTKSRVYRGVESKMKLRKFVIHLPKIITFFGIAAILLFPPRRFGDVRFNSFILNDHFRIDVMLMLGQIVAVCVVSIALGYIFKTSTPIKNPTTKKRKR